MSLSIKDKGNHDISIGLPQFIRTTNICLVPHVHNVPYSKYIQYEPLPNASGWDDDDVVNGDKQSQFVQSCTRISCFD